MALILKYQYIWGGQCEIDFSEVYNYIRFLIES